VTSKLIYDNLRPGMEKFLVHKQDVVELLSKGDFNVLVSLGAGDIENLVPQIQDMLNEKYDLE
jgi:UDP-N-acetylmuramate--alanine ligase